MVKARPALAVAAGCAVAMVLGACVFMDHPRPTHYRVERGDTLYSIAWRFGVDHKTLARWNNIDPPYTIYPDQRLRLSPPDGSARARRTRRVADARAGASASDRERRQRRAAASTRQRGHRNAASKAGGESEPTTDAGDARAGNGIAGNGSAADSDSGESAVGETGGDDAGSRQRDRGQRRSQAGSQRGDRNPAGASDSGWRWPTEGEVVAGFDAGEPTRKGIDIAGEAGQAVRAARAGTVVYSGSGLIGYGELIIVKHDERYLSAYGHNRERLVAEGDRVEAGQTIAHMGSTGSTRAMLHFEIRAEGRPVDPMDHLPGR